MFILITILLNTFSAQALPNCSYVADKGTYFNFTKSCFRHDVCYSEGPAIGMTKLACDKRFLSHMQASCSQYNFACLAKAFEYYTAVRNFPDSVYTDASQKGVKLLKEIAAANDTAAKNLLTLRSNNQKQWTTMNDYCSSLSGTPKSNCLINLKAIVVPDIPNKYNINGCNTLGIHWTYGDRIANANFAAKKTGLTVEQVLSTAGGDPCEGLYW